MSTRLPSNKSKSAFSLIELLTVIAIIGIISAFAVPAVGNLLKGSSLTQASNLLTDQSSAARQHALTRNRNVEVRFYRFWDSEQPGESVTDNLSSKVGNLDSAPFRALQFFETTGEVDATGKAILSPVGKFTRLPDTLIMSSDTTLSSILTDTTNHPVTDPTTNDPDLPRGVKKNYQDVSFRFLPDGSTSLAATQTTGGSTTSKIWFLTVHLLSDIKRAQKGVGDQDDQLHNFFTWTIDPLSGATKVLRLGFKK